MFNDQFIPYYSKPNESDKNSSWFQVFNNFISDEFIPESWKKEMPDHEEQTSRGGAEGSK